MKKTRVLSFIMTAMFVLSAAAFPANSADNDEPIIGDDNITNYSTSYCTADVNNDKEVNVSDLVKLSRYLHNCNDEFLSGFRYDINIDASKDVFDLIALRKVIISPEKAMNMTLVCDILETAENSKETGEFISSTDELSKYLSGLGTDEVEIKKFLETYNSSFFEKNDVVMGTMEQNYGNGIHHFPENACFLPLYPLVEDEDVDQRKLEMFFEMIGRDMSDYKSLKLFWLISEERYRYHPMIYPEKKSILLMQSVVPKVSREVSDDIVVAADFNLWGTEYSSYKYESFDKKERIEVYVADDSFLDPDYTFYIYYFDENGDRSYVGLEYQSMIQPFCSDGSWSTNQDGDHIFTGTNGSFRVIWKSDDVVVEYERNPGWWRKSLMH